MIIALTAVLLYNSGLLSSALGYGIAGRRRTGKKKSRNFQVIVAIMAWAFAIVTILIRCGGIICIGTNTTRMTDAITNAAFVSSSITLPSIGTFNQISGLLQSNWFYSAFLGLLVVCSVIVARGFIVSLQETKADLASHVPEARKEIVSSVEDAFRILTAEPKADPRQRIINSYQRMLLTAQHQGTTVTPDQTARELETAMRKMLGVRSSSIRDLTDLFEEARYSLHTITEDDANRAQGCVLAIAEEMNIALASVN